jgi:magnesium/cobalt transport protein CorA
MEILYFLTRQKPSALESVEELPSEGFIWLDIVRGTEPQWPDLVKHLTGITLHERHVKDAENVQHPSFADLTSEYEMVIFRGLASVPEINTFESKPTAFFLFEKLLVTIRPADSRSVPLIKERLNKQHARVPIRPAGLMHLILSAITDRFMDLREPLTLQLETWRNDLLDPKNPFNDWMTLMNHRNKLRTFEILCVEQEEAVTRWRDSTNVELDDHIMVRFNDLLEHIHRVMRFASDQQNSVESLVQLHFSAVAHRTNEIMRVLTVISAIFLPLSLVAGIFGMNFEYMPELKIKYAYFFALGGMAVLGTTMLIFFKSKHWF